MPIERRAFLAGLMSALAAPAIVRVSSLMPVRALPPVWKHYAGYEIADIVAVTLRNRSGALARQLVANNAALMEVMTRPNPYFIGAPAPIACEVFGAN